MGKNHNAGVQAAIDAVGGTYAALADKLKVSPEAVRKMLFFSCTPERAVEIEKATGVSREKIRPDIFVPGWTPPEVPQNLRLKNPAHIGDSCSKALGAAAPAAAPVSTAPALEAGHTAISAPAQSKSHTPPVITDEVRQMARPGKRAAQMSVEAVKAIKPKLES